MQIKKIEELTFKELDQRASALDPLCNWDNPSMPTKKELFMQHQWGILTAAKVYLVESIKE